MQNIDDMLLNLNLDSTNKGFKYIAYGIGLVLKDREFYEENIEKRLYKAILEKFSCSSINNLKVCMKYCIDKSGSHKTVSRFLFDTAKRIEVENGKLL